MKDLKKLFCLLIFSNTWMRHYQALCLQDGWQYVGRQHEKQVVQTRSYFNYHTFLVIVASTTKVVRNLFQTFYLDGSLCWLYVHNQKILCCPLPSDLLPHSSLWSSFSQPAKFLHQPLLSDDPDLSAYEGRRHAATWASTSATCMCTCAIAVNSFLF